MHAQRPPYEPGLFRIAPLRLIATALLFFILQDGPAQTSCQEVKWPDGSAASILRTSAATSDSIDILHQRIDLDLTRVGSNEIAGTCSIRFAPRVSAITELVLDLKGLIVDSVVGTGGQLGFGHVNETLTIALGATLTPSDTLEVSVHYHGDPVIDASGWGGFYTSGPYVYNLGVAFDAVPHSFGRAWFPCFDNFVERSTYEFRILTHQGRKAWCNGMRLSETALGGDTLLSHWRIEQPIPSYLVSVAAADYVDAQRFYPSIGGGLIPVDLVARAQDTSALTASFLHLPDAFAAFEQRFGAYSWNRIGYVLTGQGAMEHPTNIAYPASIANGTLTYESTMAHELAHQWFGDLVTCARAEEMYINEGYAEYLSHLFLEHVYGRERYLEEVRNNHREMVHRAHLKDEGWWPLADVPQEWTYGEHSYNKGADVLHTLRSYLGDSLFFAGHQSLLSAYAFSSLGTIELRDHLSVSTGVDLTAFFDDWILQGGWSSFEVDSFSAQPQGQQHLVTVHIEQKLRGADHLYSNVPITFTCWDGMGNAWTTPMPIELSGAMSVAIFPAPFAPAHITVNTDQRLALAITSDTDTITSTGPVTQSNANLFLTVNALPSTAVLRSEQYWVAADPDTDEPWAYAVSPDRWWRISGTLPSGCDISARFTLDGRPTVTGSLDLGLVDPVGGIPFHEDSLVLLYRVSPHQPWSRLTNVNINTIGSATDGYARIELDQLLIGDYAFGWRSSPVGVDEGNHDPKGLTIYPVPTSGMLIVDLAASDPKDRNELFLYDGDGRVASDLVVHDARTTIGTQHLANGVYLLEWRRNGRVVTTRRVVVSH